MVGFTLSSHWLLKIFSFIPTGCCDNFGFINFQIEAGGGAETVIEQLKQEKVHFVHVHRYHFHDCKCSWKLQLVSITFKLLVSLIAHFFLT